MFDRLLLDANMVLNAAFIETSWARRVVSIAASRKLPVFVGVRSLGDAHARAQQIAASTGRLLNAAGFIDARLRAIGAIVVPGIDVAVPDGFPRHDSHLLGEAAAANATIVTMDRELWLACKAAGVLVLLPMEIFRHFDGMGLALTAFGIAPTRVAGSVFAKAHAGGWAGGTGSRHTIIDLPGAIWLSYSTTDGSWIAEVEGLQPLAVRAPTENGRLETVALSWAAGDHIRLRSSAARHPAQQRLALALPTEIPREFSIGSQRSGVHAWNSTVYSCVFSDRPISSDLWRHLKEHRDLTPNPFDDDRLDAAIRRWCIHELASAPA